MPTITQMPAKKPRRCLKIFFLDSERRKYLSMDRNGFGWIKFFHFFQKTEFSHRKPCAGHDAIRCHEYTLTVLWLYGGIVFDVAETRYF